MNRWELTNEVKEKYLPVVKDFINRLEAVDIDASVELLEEDFSGTELNPYTLCEILKTLGYDEHDRGENGWQLDFWIIMTHPQNRPISVQGCGMTFELSISETEE